MQVKLADCRVRIAGTSFRDASKIAEDLIALFPEDLDGYILHARALLGLGKHDKVVALARGKLPAELSGVADSYVTRHGESPVRLVGAFCCFQSPRNIVMSSALSRQVEELFVLLVQAIWCSDGTEKALEVRLRCLHVHFGLQFHVPFLYNRFSCS